MAFDAFLKIDGVPGDSTDKNHAHEIALVSFSWGAVQPSSRAGGGGGGAGKVAMQDFRFATNAGIASPLLMQACATGQRFATATLSVRKAGANPVDYFQVLLSDVLVTSFSTGSTPTETGTYSPLSAATATDPLDQFTLGFGKINYSVSPIDARGARGTAVTSGFNVGTNAKA